jgi:hypothetical protein
MSFTYKILKGITNQLNADGVATGFPQEKTNAGGPGIISYLKRCERCASILP